MLRDMSFRSLFDWFLDTGEAWEQLDEEDEYAIRVAKAHDRMSATTIAALLEEVEDDAFGETDLAA